MVANTECRAKGEALQKSNRCAISTQGKDISKIFSRGKPRARGGKDPVAPATGRRFPCNGLKNLDRN